MAFSDYKYIGQVQKEFTIKSAKDNFVVIERISPTEIFSQEIAFTRQSIPFRSESSRSEAIIFPILREVYKSYSEFFTIWIQEPITYNEKLTGAPDYLIAGKSPLGITVMEKPFSAMVEAKRSDFDYGWGQCLAELIAAQKLNDNENLIVYGVVTDGQLWQIGKLEKDIFTQNSTDFTSSDLPELFGALHFVFTEIKKQL